jgi:Tol biopolymer transport system component
VGADEAIPIPGTQDGVTPAWSPDDEWIAFSRLQRTDSVNHFCIHPGAFVPCAVQDRTDYELGEAQLTLIRPNGDGVSVLGAGTDPAWSPDGGSLYFHRADAIWRAATDGSSAAPVPGTADGREPAVSPDGRFLAFSRLSANGDYDIWVIALEPSS